MKIKSVILTALGLSLVAGAPTSADTGKRSGANFVQSCAILVNHKHPGLKGDAWKAEWNICNKDRVAYRDSK